MKRRTRTLDIDAMPTAIAESVRAVLAQRGLLEAIESQDPEAFRSLFGELGRNAAQGAICAADVELIDEDLEAA